LYSKKKKHDITSLLGQMCPPAATSMAFRELGPIVPLGMGWVIYLCSLPGVAVLQAGLVMVHTTTGLDRGCGAVVKGTRHGQWRGQSRGEGAFCGFSGFTG
jgi:hypothetical protein